MSVIQLTIKIDWLCQNIKFGENNQLNNIFKAFSEIIVKINCQKYG